jgi:hypothetical protein
LSREVTLPAARIHDRPQIGVRLVAARPVVADLVEQFMRHIETACGFDAATRLAVVVSPILDARDHAGDCRN